MELVLEQIQQGTSYEVSGRTEGVEELKGKVKIKGEKKEAILTLRQKPEFGLLSDPENQSEEEVAEVMREPTMEEYMMKTREDYGSGIARPKIDDKAHFELKGQFLKELRDNIQILNSKGAIPTMKAADAKTYDGLATIQAQLNNLGREIKKMNEKVYAAQVGCESCGGRYRATAPGFYQRDSGNPLYQERRQTMEELLSKFMAESAKRHDENSNLIKEI
ncbi:hypothetical protein Tco_0173678 [Tanacetum coccineum]